MLLSQGTAVVGLVVLLLLTGFVVHAPDAAAASGPAGTITSPITDSGLDTNGNGLYDYLAITVPVDVTSAGMFAIYVNLAQPVDVRVFLAVGLQTIQARVYGWSLYNAGFDGPYNVALTLENGLNLTVLDTASYTTTAYRAADFDPPAAIIESVGTAWPVDTNGNGLYDELRLNYSLNVTGTGSFDLEARVSGQSGGDVRWADTPDVSEGVHDLTFVFPGGLVNASHMFGNLHYALYVFQWFQESSYSAGYSVSFRIVTTATYYYTEFDPPWVRTVQPYSDRGIDVDGDGLYEEIDVHVALHLDRPSNVTVSGTLGPSPYVFANNVFTQALPAGDTGVDLLFSTFAFETAKVSGPYTATVDLTASILPGYVSRTGYATAAYAYTDLSPPSASFGTPGWTAVDTNSDGASEFLDVGVNVTAAKSGDYFVQGYMDPGSGTPCCLEAGHFVHLAAGATQNMTLRYSGFAVNRTATQAPWAVLLSATRLDGIAGDRTSTSSSTYKYSASQFAWGYPVILNGTLRSITRGAPIPYAYVMALDPSRGFWVDAQTNATGGYSLPVYNGTILLAATLVGSGTDQPIARTVVVAGNTSADLGLPRTPVSTYAWDTAFSDWYSASVTLTRNTAMANESVRIAADLAGNFDGIANVTELSWWARYPFMFPYAMPTRFPAAGNLGMTMDGQDLAVGPEAVAILQGEGGLADTSPIVVRSTSTFQSNSAPSPGPDHTVGVRMYYDVPSFDANLSLSLPAGTQSTAMASANVTLSHTGPTTWIIDPKGAPAPNVLFATATLTASPAADPTPPTAAFAVPAAGERLVPMDFDGSGSTDNVGVTNYTWNVNANGTIHTAYGAHAQLTFDQIGSFVVTLTVRDAAGNAGTVSHSVTVQDTTPPPTPSGLSAVVTMTPGGAAVSLTWNKVGADDLAAYRVYESLDGGSTYRFAGRVASSGTSFTEILPTAASVTSFRVSSVDRYGNEGSPSASIPVPIPSSTSPPTSALPLAILVLAIAVAAGVVFLIIRSRRKKEPPSERGPVA